MAINTDSQVDLMQQQYRHWGRDGMVVGFIAAYASICEFEYNIMW